MDSLQDWLSIRLGGRVAWALRRPGEAVVYFATAERRLAAPVRLAALRRADAEGELERDTRSAWLAAEARPGAWAPAAPSPPKAEPKPRGRRVAAS